MNNVKMQDKSDRYPISWFLKLRRIAFLGQLTVLLWAKYVAEISFPLIPIISVLALIPIAELIFNYFQQNKLLSSKQFMIGVLLMTDIFILTLLLYFSGGPANPFSLVYLVHVVLAAVILSSFWAWLAAFVSTVCFSLLFIYHIPVPQLDHGHSHHGHSHHGAMDKNNSQEDMSLHLKGMLFSYILVAALIAYFLSRILNELREAESRAVSLAESRRKLAALSALSAEAAHEVSTPLATIDLIAHELMQKFAGETSEQALAEDLKLLVAEAARCKSVLKSFCDSSGSIGGEAPSFSDLSDLIEELKVELKIDSSQLTVKGIPLDKKIFTQIKPLAIALKVLIKNALQAHLEANLNKPITLKVTREEDLVKFQVIDYGAGIDIENMSRIKEPFYSNRKIDDLAKGKFTSGMGLGSYIAELIAIQLNGGLEYDSKVGSQTVAVLTVPISLDE